MIVIPMAGMSSRFTKAGYTKPKYMLEANGKTLFHYSISSFSAYFASEDLLFIFRDVQDTEGFIKSECAALGIPEQRILLCNLDAPTTGQAETVALGLRSQQEKLDEPILIFNIDTYRPDYTYPSNFEWKNVDGYLEVFKAEGDHWSFAKPDPDSSRKQAVGEVAEKVRISDLCSSGMYSFKSGQLFLDYYQRIENKPLEELQGNERYIAPLYNDLIADGLDVRYELVPSKDVISMGTPAEYEDLIKRMRI